MICEALIAMTCNIPFKIAYKRAMHLRYGHPFDETTHIDKLISELHPATDIEYVYTLNIRKCNTCGLYFIDQGLEHRNPLNIGKVDLPQKLW